MQATILGRRKYALAVATLLSTLVYGIIVYKRQSAVGQKEAAPKSESVTWFKTSHATDKGNVSFVYNPYADVTEGEKVPPGRPFVFGASYLASIGFPLQDRLFVTEPDPSSLPNDDFAVVTAASGHFLYIDMDAIALIQRNLPQQRIIFYDLGGIEERFVTKIRKLCNVEYRKFNFNRYPSHVAELKTYAWKPIVIHDVLQTYSVVLWMDSSMRLRTNNLTRSFLKAKDSGGILLFDFSGHSVFAATHEGLYTYLPIDKHTAGMAGMYGANGILLYRKRQMYDSVVRWWFLCALTGNCIAPTRKLNCAFAQGPLRHWKYGNCHRFDQSALGVLLANNISLWRRHEQTKPANSTKTPDPSVVDLGADQLELGRLVGAPDSGQSLMATERGAVDQEKFYVCGDRKRSEMTNTDLRKPREYLSQ